MNSQLRNLLSTISTRLLKIYQSSQTANNIAWWILTHITGFSKAKLLTQNISLNIEQENLLETILDKHINNNMPLQYIFGHVDFLDLKITVKPPILIPRAETEEWCQNLIINLKNFKNKNLTILDLCTGSGCIGLALASHLASSRVYLLDISSAACNLAALNAKNNNILNVEIIESDLFENLDRNLKFDLIIANPPYIPFSAWKQLDATVKDWEDKIALTAKSNGLEIIKKIIINAKKWLKINTEFIEFDIPQIVLEIDCTQGQIVKELLEKSNFNNIKIQKDSFGKDRVVSANINLK